VVRFLGERHKQNEQQSCCIGKVKRLRSEARAAQVDEIISLVETWVEGGAYAPTCPKTYIVNGEQNETPVRYVVIARDERNAERDVVPLGVRVTSIELVDGPTML
jgi:hypothetical protein